jgi:hypothetical protein
LRFYYTVTEISNFYPINLAIRTKQTTLGDVCWDSLRLMESFVPEQDEGVFAPAATGTAFGQTLNKPPVPWPMVVAMFKTTSIPKPATPIIPNAPPLIAQNITLDQDKATVLRCWLAIGSKEDTLRRKYGIPRDDVSE